MRGDPEQSLALGERLGHEAKLEVLQIPQAPVDELGRGRRGARSEVVLLDEQHSEAPAGGVAGYAGTVDAAADNQQVVALAGLHEGKPLRDGRLAGL